MHPFVHCTHHRATHCIRALTLLFIMAALTVMRLDRARAQMGSFPTTFPFSWSEFVRGYYPGFFTVTNYWTAGGKANGPIYTTTTPIYDTEKGPDTASLDTVGAATFQYVLWEGYARGRQHAFGAGFFGGFNLTDTKETTNWSYIQIYKDTTTSRGKWAIDDSTSLPIHPRGRVNGEVTVNYGMNPGWKYPGTQYGFLDLPFDLNRQPAETVSFETALVSYDANSVTIRGDWTWSFTTAYDPIYQTEKLSGQPVIAQAQASSDLLNLYQTTYPGVTYYQAPLPNADVPEPGSVALCVSLSAAAIGLWVRCRRGGRSRFSPAVPARIGANQRRMV